MARLRLGYTKSRNGCLRCKQRRVKCDENRPCRACVRHNVECSLVSSASTPGSDDQSTPSPQPPQAPLKSPPPERAPLRPLAPSQPSPVPDYIAVGTTDTIDKLTTANLQDGTRNWIADLELLHHFTTITCKTLFTPEHSNPYGPDLWQIEMPKLGFTFPFLLHQILAISALHLAHLYPRSFKKYSFQASQHQSVAIHGAHQALSNITTENCHAIFAASSLFFIGALAADGPNPDNPDGPTLERLVDVFYLVKGIGGLLNNSESTLRQGPFGPFFRTVATEVHSQELNSVSTRIDKFLAHVEEVSREDPVRTIVEAEVASFGICAKRALATTQTPEYRIIASWPNLMTDRFISLLRQRNPAALALLSYYCVIMHATESGYWFTRGWSFRIIQDISRSMAAPWDEHSAWAQGWITGHREVAPSPIHNA